MAAKRKDFSWSVLQLGGLTSHWRCTARNTSRAPSGCVSLFKIAFIFQAFSNQLNSVLRDTKGGAGYWVWVIQNVSAANPCTPAHRWSTGLHRCTAAVCRQSSAFLKKKKEKKIISDPLCWLPPCHWARPDYCPAVNCNTCSLLKQQNMFENSLRIQKLCSSP